MKTKHTPLHEALLLVLSGLAIVSANAQTTVFHGNADVDSDPGGLAASGELVFTGEDSWQRSKVGARSLPAGFSTGFIFAGEEVNRAPGSYQLCFEIPAKPAADPFGDETLRDVSIVFYDDVVKPVSAVASAFRDASGTSADRAIHSIPSGRAGSDQPASPPHLRDLCSRGVSVVPQIRSGGASFRKSIPTPHPRPPTETLFTAAGADR